MPRKTTKQRKQWSLNIDEEIVCPKKPSYLDIAVGRLGPFPFETKAEALSKGEYVELDRERFGISRELAAEYVENTARRFNKEEYLSRGAPRFKHVIENLSELRRLAIALKSHLDSLDDITRHELQFAGASKDRVEESRNLMILADAEGLSKKAGDRDRGAPSWAARLGGLAFYAEITGKNLLDSRKNKKLSVKDIGGNTDLWKEEVGSPRWGLVHDALKIYEIFQPDRATGTVGGPLHSFILALYEYATGREGDDHAKIDDLFKKLVKAHREDKLLEAQEDEREIKWKKIIDRDPKLRKKSNRERADALDKEILEIMARRKALWRIMFPHVRI